MKKWVALVLSLILAWSGALVVAEDAPMLGLGTRSHEQAYEELIVGSPTMMSGHFFTDMWGHNASDLDVQELVHGHRLAYWAAEEGMFTMDPSVVSGIVANADAQGNKTYTIALSDGLRYNDGSRITAKDYAFSILLHASPAVAEIGGQTNGADHIVGVEEYKRGEADTITGVRVLNDSLLSITVRADYLPFFYEVALLGFIPYPIAVIAPGCELADIGEGVFIRNSDAQETVPRFTAVLLAHTILDAQTGYMSHPRVTSGPYVMTEYDDTAHIATFEINPYFKGMPDGQKPSIERLTYKAVSPDTILQQLLDGEIDLLNKCTQADVVGEGLSAASQYGLYMSNYMRSGLAMLSFCCEQGPAQFQAVRQAVAYCLDRDAFIADYVSYYGLAVNGYYGLGQWMTQVAMGTITMDTQEVESTDDEGALAQEALRQSLEALNTYALDVEKAVALLTADGWVLNESGGPFQSGVDAVRCKLVDGALMPLSLTAVVPEDNEIGILLEAVLAENLSTAGGQLTLVQVPFDELLETYYRQQPRDCAMLFLGTNFVNAFDPMFTYSTEDVHQGAQNTTGLRDQTLMDLARDMRSSQVGDVFAYCRKWMAFQTYWNEVLPAVPLYTNVYFDFYVPRLQNYLPDKHATWTQAIVYAYLSDAMMEDEEEGLFTIY